MNQDAIKQQYLNEEGLIKERLEEFEGLRDASDYRMFKELVFVIITSQTSARKSWEATEEMAREDMLRNGGKDEIASLLDKYEVQYERNKAKYIVSNRKKLSQPTLNDPTSGLKIRNKIDVSDLKKTRAWLVENIDGLSWKGASHFLRNIGYGDDFAILSGYISKTMFKLGILEDPEPPKNKEEYLEQEEKFRKLSRDTGIETGALDLVIWSLQTGEVFK